MNRGLSDRLRCFILGSAATGLLLPSSVVLGQTKNAVSSNKKKPAVPQVVEPPRLLNVPENAGAPANSIRPVSQMEVADAEKSDVQRELEALYQQDGREMPSLNLQPLAPLSTQTQQSPQTQQSDTIKTPAATRPSQPKPTATQKPAPRPAQTYPGYSSRPGATVYAPQVPIISPTQTPTQVPRYSNLFNDAQTTPQVQPPEKAPAQNPKMGFFKRITSNTSTKPKYNPSPVPPDYHETASASPAVPTVPAVPPSSAANAPTTSPIQQGMKYYTPPNQTSPVRQANQPGMATANSKAVPGQPGVELQVLVTNNTVPNLPQPSLPMPPLNQQPLPLPIMAVQSPLAQDVASLPPLMTEAQQPGVAIIETPAPVTSIAKAAPATATATANAPATAPATATATEKPTTSVTITETATDFPNPFPEASEAEVDNRPFKMPKRREILSKAYTEEESPKSAVVKQAKPESIPNPVAKSEEDPFAVKAKDFVEPSPSNKTAAKVVQNDNIEFLPPIIAKVQETNTPSDQSNPANSVQPSTAGRPPEFDIAKMLGAPPLDAAKSTDGTSPSALGTGTEDQKLTPPSLVEEQQLEKMRKIRERFGMKGLKGFCPVTLHDERDLVDAKPEFHFTHRSQKFHFASAEARDKFEADPVKYAPAAYGADVVALGRDRDVLEGTLDFAAWFKGRLYLFGSQENYEIFIENPAKFATLNGIE